MKTIGDVDLDARYPSPLVRGDRIARLGEKYIGPAASDAVTCRVLGEEQVGWFIGGVPTYDRMIEFVRRIDASQVGGRWIIVPATRCLAEVAYQLWFENESPGISKTSPTMWDCDSVTFCVPEQLGDVQANIYEDVAGIILLDPNCIVHCGRGFGNGKYRVAHDRPQLIVDFRAKLAIGRWSPPLMVMSLRRAAAVPTESVARVYGLEAMHFIEGVSLRCGAIKNNSSGVSASSTGRSSMVLVS